MKKQFESMEITERAEAISALVLASSDPRERAALKKQLAADCQLLPFYAATYLAYLLETSLQGH
jgi:hypothetical protein